MKHLTIAAALTIYMMANAGRAQETSVPAAGAPEKPVRLTAEMRQKLTECREQVSADAQYVALLKAARQAQARADDYFLAKLRQAVAADEELARYVAGLISEQKAARANTDATDAP